MLVLISYSSLAVSKPSAVPIVQNLKLTTTMINGNLYHMDDLLMIQQTRD